MSWEPQFTRLRIYNILMGLLHLAQAVFIIILSNDFKRIHSIEGKQP